MSDEPVTPEKPKKFAPADDWLKFYLIQLLGESGFHQKIELTVSGMDLYWIINLAVQGLKARETEWRNAHTGAF